MMINESFKLYGDYDMMEFQIEVYFLVSYWIIKMKYAQMRTGVSK